MKTYFRVNNPKENNAIKDLQEGKLVQWSSNSKYNVGDFILIYIAQKSGFEPRITMIAEVKEFLTERKDAMKVKLLIDLSKNNIDNFFTKQLIEENGFPSTQYNSNSYKINSNDKLFSYINDILKKNNIEINLGKLTKRNDMTDEFESICSCLDKKIKQNNNAIELETKNGTKINLIKYNKNYRIIFNSAKETYESITLDNLYKFLFENWRGKLSLSRDDNRITLFEAIGNYIKTNCKNLITIKHPLNQILYGPPGTGKTYNTINKALEILEINTENKTREELTTEFKTYKDNGQIEFITFHQSYGYEEFVEGIKAKTGDKGIEYSVEKGIFKSLCKKAKDNFEDSKKSAEILKEEKSINQNIEQFLDDALESQIEFKKTKGGKFKIKDLNESIITIYTEDSNYSENKIDLDIEEFKKIVNSDISINTSRQLAKDIFGINNQRQKDTYYFAMLKQYNKMEFDTLEDVSKEDLKNYILIIDEINRGNISKIFGELITLIEPSKRIGEDEEIFLKLPNSPEPFGVPSNLYIIGTMNTADRSIAQIDTALRRRFIFEEMMPRPELLKNIIIDTINISEMIVAINERIEYIYDREHTIGHSYFLPLINNPTKDKLDEIFKINIIPLLAEYFYGDWGDIISILNNDFICKKELKYKPKNKNIENKVYKVNDTFTIEQYQNIYKVSSKD